MQIQDYLRSGKTPVDLTNELGIKVTSHPTLPLDIFNYNQIDSPKLHPIVREARGLVLERDTWNLIAKGFDRFFNWGEVVEEISLFDFSDFVVQSKEDGSLILIYNYDGRWRCNTRATFAQDNMQFQDFSWEQGICKAFGVLNLDELAQFFDPRITYVAEFCSPWNKVVRRYETPVLYLLTAFAGTEELSIDYCDAKAPLVKMLRPTLYSFKSIEEIQKFLQDQAASDPTFEGVVIRDTANHRWKIKSATYLGLHRLKGEGDNLFNPKHLLPFVMAGEEDELLTYFPEVRPAYFELKAKIKGWYADLLEVWADNWREPDQKTFALAIKDKPFASVLFDVRKRKGAEQKAGDIREAWRNATDTILKRMKCPN